MMSTKRRRRRPNANLRTQLNRILRRAGLKAWPKLFQNSRATRQTELAESFPAHFVCAWMGNSQAVAAMHYLQVTDQHFELGKTTQNPTQTGAKLSGTDNNSRTAQGAGGIEKPENPSGFGWFQLITLKQFRTSAPPGTRTGFCNQ